MDSKSTQLEIMEPKTSAELVPRKNKVEVLAGKRGLSFENLDQMYRFCVAVVNSGTFKDINTPEVALIRLQAGLELGLSPIWALSNILVTNGRPSVWGDALLGLVLQHPECQDVIETFEGTGDELTAVCEVHRRGRLPVKRSFSVNDAKRAGLHGRNVHQTFPKRMLQMRARSWACRDAFADALRGLAVVEEQTGAADLQETRVSTAKPAIVLPEEVES